MCLNCLLIQVYLICLELVSLNVELIYRLMTLHLYLTLASCAGNKAIPSTNLMLSFTRFSECLDAFSITLSSKNAWYDTKPFLNKVVVNGISSYISRCLKKFAKTPAL